MPRLRAPLALLIPLLAGCAGPAATRQPPAAPAEPGPAPEPHTGVEPHVPHPAAPAEPVPEPLAPPPWAGTEALESHAGSYVIQYRPSPAEIPWGEPFALRVWVLGNSPAPALLDGVALSVDAAMPEHGHGMNRVPQVTPAGEGGFAVEGLLFHMPGRWELYFDVTRGALTERAQTEVELE